MISSRWWGIAPFPSRRTIDSQIPQGQYVCSLTLNLILALMPIAMHDCQRQHVSALTSENVGRAWLRLRDATSHITHPIVEFPFSC
jgi:hypothetical protein